MALLSESQNSFRHCKDKAFNEANLRPTSQSKNDIESLDGETFFGAIYSYRIQLFTVDGLKRIKVFLKARLARTHLLQRLLFDTAPHMVI